MTRVPRVAMIILTTLGLVYLAIGLPAFLFQRTMIFPAPSGAREPRQGLTIVHLHGNAEQLADSEWLAGRFVEQGFGFYAVEYPQTLACRCAGRDAGSDCRRSPSST